MERVGLTEGGGGRANRRGGHGSSVRVDNGIARMEQLLVGSEWSQRERERGDRVGFCFNEARRREV